MAILPAGCRDEFKGILYQPLVFACIKC